MTKRLEEFFNLSSSVEEENTDIEPVEQPSGDIPTEIMSSLTTAERINFALPTVVGLDSHDSEVDAIAEKAIKTYDDLILLGGNVSDLHAGKIYEVASQLLKTALDARNSKADKKLKMIELQLKKMRAEQIDFELGNAPSNRSTAEFDRNELMKYIVASKSENSDK